MTDSNTPILDQDEILAGIRTWVEIESPTTDAAAVNRVVDQVATVVVDQVQVAAVRVDRAKVVTVEARVVVTVRQERDNNKFNKVETDIVYNKN